MEGDFGNVICSHGTFLMSLGWILFVDDVIWMLLDDICIKVCRTLDSSLVGV